MLKQHFAKWPIGTCPLSPLSNLGILTNSMSTPFRIKQVWLRRISAVSVFVLLAAQIGLAAYACPKLSTILGEGINTATQLADVPCDEMDMQQPSVCHEHCKDQASADRVQLPGVAPAMVMANNLTVPIFDTQRASAPTNHAEPDLTRVTRPPPSVLFCVFRI